MNLTRDERSLRFDGAVVLDGMGSELEVEPDPEGSGVFIHARAELSNSRLVFDLGGVPSLVCFSACHRYEPYWMKAVSGERLSQVPSETQWLLARLRLGTRGGGERDVWLLVVPLFGELLRFSLRAALGAFSPSSTKLERLELLGETGDPFAPGHGGLAAYVAVLEDPFALCEAGARSVMVRLGTGRLRRDKPLPDFCDRFGWCTWDAFYQEVSLDKVREGLAQFQSGGVEPRWLILDDGWQTERRMPTGERRLTSFAANDKFPGGLGATVRMAKTEFAIERLLVWHTIVGYWGGTDGKSFPEYRVSEAVRRFGEGIMEHRPSFNEQWWGPVVGLPAPQDAARLFDDYHGRLAAEGVDGVKVDSQAVLEGVATGQGGRVPLTLAYRRALEGSVGKHFAGRLINCMSNGQETWYGSFDSTLLRSSIDFFPRFPESHGAHLYSNALVGVWFGHFMQPDWDMFQSGHEWGWFHAAARAISGGPVYVSDKPGHHDFSLLQQLVCSDGSVLRCDAPGVPTLRSLCHDPTREAVLLQIRNRNGRAGIIGAFNCQYAEGSENLISDEIEVRDALGSEEGASEVACFRHRAQSLERLPRDAHIDISLAQGRFELFTIVPIEQGFAAIGLADKFNSRGAVSECRVQASVACVALRDGGRFLAFSERSPRGVECEGSSLAFRYDAKSGRLDVDVPRGRAPLVVVRLG